MIDFRRPLEMGQIEITPAAKQALREAGVTLKSLLARFLLGDYGLVDKAANQEAEEAGDAVLGCYRLSTGVEILVFTEADRSVTAVLLKSEA